MTLAERKKSGLILGIGNILMGDEGAGPHTIRLLAKMGVPAGWTAEDGGTGGFHLLHFFQDYDPIIIVDASLDRHKPGTVQIKEPRYASDYPKSLSAHDVGLYDLVQSAQLLGYDPKIFLITISINQFQDLKNELSVVINGSLKTAVENIYEICNKVKLNGQRSNPKT